MHATVTAAPWLLSEVWSRRRIQH